MPQIEHISHDKNFSKELINQQLEKIFAHYIFAFSDILKRFLSFIVEETLAGHANQLKEYTIGVKVLNKPADYKPQQDGIVRIHARRLRRALHHYYKETGDIEHIHISIPKGSYIPVFGENTEMISEEINMINTGSIYKSIIVAVMPFRHFETDTLKILFADGLGVQLSNVLTSIKNLSVIAYHAMRHLVERVPEIQELAAAVGAQYIITGDIQTQNEYVRVNVQLINTVTIQQTWSNAYEYKLSALNIFEVQNNIVKQVIAAVNDSHGFIKRKAVEKSIMAVA